MPVVLSVVVHGGIALGLIRLPASATDRWGRAVQVEVQVQEVRPSGHAAPTQRSMAAKTRVPRSRSSAVKPKAGARSPTSPPRSPSPSPSPPPLPSVAPPDPAVPSSPGAGRVDLFAGAALERVVGTGGPTDGAGYRPRHGVGHEARGGLDLGSFLVEDAGRARVDKGVVPPGLREAERVMAARFDPPFGHVDVANKRELFRKQFIGRLKTPPRVRELSRAEDPARESNGEKLKRIVREPYFLGRFTEVFVRQGSGGTILEMLVRTSSGFRSFDDDAIAAVSKALEDSPPPEARAGSEVRTLWRLEATAYVVYSPTPVGEFDEATGKVQMYYPLQKRVDHKVKLVAVY